MSEHPKTDGEQSVNIPPNSRIDVRSKWPKGHRRAALGLLAVLATGGGYSGFEVVPAIVDALRAGPEAKAEISKVREEIASSNTKLDTLNSTIVKGMEEVKLAVSKNNGRLDTKDEQIGTLKNEVDRLRDAQYRSYRKTRDEDPDR